MTEISQSQFRREAAEIALWESPSPEPDAAARALLSQFDSSSNDQGVGNNAVGDGSRLPDLGPLSSFGSWESVAATIVHKAASVSGFDPGGTTFDLKAWNDFLTKFATIPLCLQYVYDYREANISSLSLKSAVDAVDDLLKSFMSPENYLGVVESIKKVGQLALSTERQTEKNSNQQIGCLSVHASRLYLGVVRTTVSMEHKKGKGYEQLTQTLQVYRGYGVLDFDKCKRSADKLLGWDGKDVDDWANDTASASQQPNQSPAWDN
ncbi:MULTISPECIES: hypothetical protein [unclassified Streptomyces]|jgi:hypothetical protein|uniref:hypothetical protein n=1 Tax=unclassified Streptomyces TaxID=2593676 RepID=UPI00332127A6